MITNWETINSKKVANYRIFDVVIKERINPLTNEKGEFTILESNDWVNIIPITENNEIIIIEQYRHGTDSITLEIPGGLIEKGELPIEAAKRECSEETGYISNEEPILTGITRPNPAYQNNTCYSFVWKNCRLLNSQNLDRHEIINIHKFSFDKVKNMIQNGEINHSVILTAFYLFHLKFGF